MPDPLVVDRLDRQHLETLFLSAITLAELRLRCCRATKRKRREGLGNSLEHRIVALFGTRILSFDNAASEAYATIRAHPRRVGKAIGATDGYIAATAAAHGFTIATRDTTVFEAAGVPIINPWLQS